MLELCIKKMVDESKLLSLLNYGVDVNLCDEVINSQFASRSCTA